MEKMSQKELDDRIHSFLNRKYSELATLERIPRINNGHGPSETAEWGTI